jgi:hypothetical protein
MLDPQTYRASELLAKSMSPHWRVAQTHNLDHFERSGFPVRISSIREIGQIIDSMQENRFATYMSELDGLTSAEHSLALEVCRDSVRFQMGYLPHRPPVLPISTLLSVLVLYKKLRGINPDFRTLLEVGPGCGYLSFVLRHHKTLENYSQIEACESFYVLQNLVNHYCFGHRSDDRALPPKDSSAIDIFTNPGPHSEFSPAVHISKIRPLSTHYPWWRIGEIVAQERKFDIVTSNANLLEFNSAALDDYLSLIHRVLSPEGAFLVQCIGYPARGEPESVLLEKIYQKRFAPLLFVNPHIPIKCPATNVATVKHTLSQGTLPQVTFNVTNALFVRDGHPLFQRYYDQSNFFSPFVAPEAIVVRSYFDRPPGRRDHTLQSFVEETEKSIE